MSRCATQQQQRCPNLIVIVTDAVLYKWMSKLSLSLLQNKYFVVLGSKGSLYDTELKVSEWNLDGKHKASNIKTYVWIPYNLSPRALVNTLNEWINDHETEKLVALFLFVCLLARLFVSWFQVETKRTVVMKQLKAV